MAAIDALREVPAERGDPGVDRVRHAEVDLDESEEVLPDHRADARGRLVGADRMARNASVRRRPGEELPAPGLESCRFGDGER